MESTTFFILVENLLETSRYNLSSSLIPMTENKCDEMYAKFLLNDGSTRVDMVEVIHYSLHLLHHRKKLLTLSKRVHGTSMELLNSAISMHLAQKHGLLLTRCNFVGNIAKIILSSEKGDVDYLIKILVSLSRKLGIEWLQKEISSRVNKLGIFLLDYLSSSAFFFFFLFFLIFLLILYNHQARTGRNLLLFTNCFFFQGKVWIQKPEDTLLTKISGHVDIRQVGGW